jgi:hypothetical protein
LVLICLGKIWRLRDWGKSLNIIWGLFRSSIILYYIQPLKKKLK